MSRDVRSLEHSFLVLVTAAVLAVLLILGNGLRLRLEDRLRAVEQRQEAVERNQATALARLGDLQNQIAQARAADDQLRRDLDELRRRLEVCPPHCPQPGVIVCPIVCPRCTPRGTVGPQSDRGGAAGC